MESTEWLEDFKQLLAQIRTTSHEVTTLLSLLSASLANGQPLPPYLQTPSPYGLSDKLEALDPDILSVRHINEPGYATFAVMQISSRCIIHELDDLLKLVFLTMKVRCLKLTESGTSRKLLVNWISHFISSAPPILPRPLLALCLIQAMAIRIRMIEIL